MWGVCVSISPLLSFFLSLCPPQYISPHTQIQRPSGRQAAGEGSFRRREGSFRRRAGSFRRRAGSTLDGEGGEAGKKILVKPENIAEVQADEGAAGEL